MKHRNGSQYDFYDSLTPEELDAMVWANEHFCGKTMSFQKMSDYLHIKEAAQRMSEQCPEVKEFSEMEPNQRERNAAMCVDCPSAFSLDKRDADTLADLVAMSDSVVVCATGDGIRMTFGVEGVWED